MQGRAEVLPWQAVQPSGGPAARWGDGDGALLLCRCTLSGGTMAVYAGGAEDRMDEWGMAASVRCARLSGRCRVPGGQVVGWPLLRDAPDCPGDTGFRGSGRRMGISTGDAGSPDRRGIPGGQAVDGGSARCAGLPGRGGAGDGPPPLARLESDCPPRARRAPAGQFRRGGERGTAEGKLRKRTICGIMTLIL